MKRKIPTLKEKVLSAETTPPAQQPNSLHIVCFSLWTVKFLHCSLTVFLLFPRGRNSSKRQPTWITILFYHNDGGHFQLLSKHWSICWSLLFKKQCCFTETNSWICHMDIYIDMNYIMFLNFDSINILFCLAVNFSFSSFSFSAFNLFSLSSVAMQNCLKDIQAINVQVGLNWVKQAAWCADRLFSSNISTKSPLWHHVGQSWSLGARSPCSVLHNDLVHHSWAQLHFPYSPTASTSGLMTRSSGLTSFMGKYFNFSHGKNCHLAQVSWLPYTSVRIISLKTYFFGQQGENTVLFLSFLSKYLYLIYVNSQKQDRTMNSTWAQQLPINDTYAGSE